MSVETDFSQVFVVEIKAPLVIALAKDASSLIQPATGCNTSYEASPVCVDVAGLH